MIASWVGRTRAAWVGVAAVDGGILGSATAAVVGVLVVRL